ncbi:MAG: enoyl-CoA hydratase-related protein, partial [Cytophagales bacterium]
MKAYKNLLIETQENTQIIKLNRPEKLNSLNFEMLSELNEVIENFYIQENIWGMVITGTGEKAFAAGADISEFSNLNEINGRKASERGQELFDRIENCFKPIIAAVNGYALGGGCELALSCHLRVGSHNAKFGLPEVNLGLIPGYGGTQRLPRIIGKGRAMELILTGDHIDA